MGCWNKTCGLTGLPILAGDPVYVFVLEQNQYHDRCYASAFWRPVLVPFESTYNDYGGGEDSTGIALEPIMNAIKKELIEMEQGDNEYHDIPVKKEKFDVELFFDAVHEGRLFIDSRNGKTSVDFVMMRKDVVDKILSDHRFDQYIGDGKGTHGWGKNYVKIGFDDYVNVVDNVIKKIKETDPMFKFLGVHFDYKTERLESYICRSNDDFNTSRILRPFDVVFQFLDEGKDWQAKAFLIEFCKGIYINSFMSAVRKVWMPGGHEGSQSSEWDDYLFLSDIIKGIVKDITVGFEDEDEEE